jgi:hypothetical protein
LVLCLPGVREANSLQLDERYFKGLRGQYWFDLHFVLQKEGCTPDEYICRVRAEEQHRSVSCELHLEAGRYEVIPKVTANRATGLPLVEEVVKLMAMRKPQKLRQIGMQYDLAHAKGGVTDEDGIIEKKRADVKAKIEERKRKMKDERRRRAMEHAARAMHREAARLNRAAYRGERPPRMREEKKEDGEHDEKSKKNEKRDGKDDATDSSSEHGRGSVGDDKEVIADDSGRNTVDEPIKTEAAERSVRDDGKEPVQELTPEPDRKDEAAIQSAEHGPGARLEEHGQKDDGATFGSTEHVPTARQEEPGRRDDAAEHAPIAHQEEHGQRDDGDPTVPDGRDADDGDETQGGESPSGPEDMRGPPPPMMRGTVIGFHRPPPEDFPAEFNRERPDFEAPDDDYSVTYSVLSDVDSSDGDDLGDHEAGSPVTPWNAVCVMGLRVYAQDPDVTIALVRPDSMVEAASLTVTDAPAGATM